MYCTKIINTVVLLFFLNCMFFKSLSLVSDNGSIIFLQNMHSKGQNSVRKGLYDSYDKFIGIIQLIYENYKCSLLYFKNF